MARLAVLVLVSMLLQGQGAAQTATARIGGQVIDDGTKAPIAGARVVLMPNGRPMGGPPPQATTDATGRFVFEPLAPGSYRIQATKGGFAPAPSNAVLGSIEVRAGATVDNVTFTLQRGGAISGRILDANGEPVVEMRVNAQRATVTGQSAMLTQAGPGAQTNDLGDYRIYGLPPGEYYVQAGGFMGMPSTAPMASRLASTFFPAARESRDAKPVAVAAGQTASDINIRMDVEALFQIRGVVVDDQGLPVGGAILSVTPERMSAGPTMMGPMGRIESQPDGTFSIVNLPSGGYAVTAAQPLVVSTQSMGPGGGVGAYASSGFVSGGASGLVGGGGIATATEQRNGVTTTYQYRTDASKSVRVSIEDANVNGLRVVALSPPPKP